MRKKGAMPDIAFRLMAATFKITDFFASPTSKLDNLGIKPGDTVIDYGCGPGRYLQKAAQLTGGDGMVYAVDIHPLAIKSIEELVRREQLSNVNALQASNMSVDLPEQTADIIYAFDMFHMVENSSAFLQELHRLIKAQGTMFIEPGHQARKLAREKIEASGVWEICAESQYFTCKPRY